MNGQEKQLFDTEERILERYRNLAFGRRSQSSTDIYTREEFSKFVNSYEELLNQAKFITKISDRLEKKLESVNHDLHTKNTQLQSVLTELTKARVSNRARAIIYTIAVILFVLEEFFIEPVIDFLGNGMLLGFLLKLSIVLLLKPAETLLESRLLKNNIKKQFT